MFLYNDELKEIGFHMPLKLKSKGLYLFQDRCTSVISSPFNDVIRLVTIFFDVQGHFFNRKAREADEKSAEKLFRIKLVAKYSNFILPSRF